MSAAASESPTFAYNRRIEEVVLPLTFTVADERIVPLAVGLAKRWGVRLRLVNVSDLIDANDPQLQGFADQLSRRHQDVDVVTTHIYGHDVAFGIASSVMAHSLVVMATDHADEWSPKGSVAEAVLFSAGVPVLLFGPNAKHLQAQGNVIIGLDGSASAEAALPAASGLAASLGTTLWLVQVVPTLDEGSPIDTEIAHYIQDQAEMMGSQSVAWEIIHSNDPVSALRTFAAAREAGVIVAGARGRTDPHRQTMGSITMGLVATAEIPVLAIAVPPEA